MPDFGYVIGRFVESVAHGTDAPDLVASKGAVRVQPAQVTPQIDAPGGTATAVRTPRRIKLDQHGTIGEDDGGDFTPGMWLAVGRHKITTSFWGDTPDWEFEIEVTADHTPDNPLDLTLAAPVDLPPGSVEVVRVEDRDRAEAAADQAQAVMDGIEGAILDAVEDMDLVQGPPGEQGERGPRGYDGPEGAEGPQGEQGETGEPGQDGADGEDGSDGSDGASAYQVALGQGFEGSPSDWIDSLAGPAGQDGSDGDDGSDGSDGHSPEITFDGTRIVVDGETGPDLQGSTGEQGEQGERGQTGPEGPEGPQGETGDRGPQGEDGPQGETGDTGPSGSIQNGMTVVLHGDDPDTDRPEDALIVWWVGSAEPENAATHDVWDNSGEGS